MLRTNRDIQTSQAIQQLFPDISNSEKQLLLDAVSGKSSIVEVKAGTMIFMPGQTCTNYLLLLEGKMKIFSTAENGKEILLYRIRPGETCILSTNCLMGSAHYPASAKTETDCIALSISNNVMLNALDCCHSLNQFLMQSFSKRIASLIELIGEVALERLDVRLARHLIYLAEGTDEIHITHEALAKEVGTAREVVTRQLAQFENSNWIVTQRGMIQIKQNQPLTDLSNGFFVN